MEGDTPAVASKGNAAGSHNLHTSAGKEPSATTAATGKPVSVQTPKKVATQAAKTPAPSAKTQAVSSRKSLNTSRKPILPKQKPSPHFPDGLASKMDRNAGQLGLIGDVKEEKIEDKYHYFTGNFYNRAEAEQMLRRSGTSVSKRPSSFRVTANNLYRTTIKTFQPYNRIQC